MEQRKPVPGDKLDEVFGMKDGDPKNMMTNVEGLYAFGEVNYQYHGATRLGANALLSCIFDGLFCGSSVANYVKGIEDKAADKPEELYQKYIDQEKAKIEKLVSTNGKYNPYEIHARLGDEMTASCTVVKNEERMLQCYEALKEMKAQYKDLKLSDTGEYTNQNVAFARALGDMIVYAEAILHASLERKESRGSHYRSDFPDRVDDPFHKTAVVSYDVENDKPVLEWQDVPMPMVELRKRDYSK